jgi:hypothetical protein
VTDNEALYAVQDWLTTDPNGPAPVSAIAQVVTVAMARGNKLNEIAHCLFTLGLTEDDNQQWSCTRPDGSKVTHPSLAAAAADLWQDYSTRA